MLHGHCIYLAHVLEVVEQLTWHVVLSLLVSKLPREQHE
jgi:hypothetical protein